ncbi:hypothetical protein [Facklamia lactis]|nr:hypothetical protein [Facklamia lactis]
MDPFWVLLFSTVVIAVTFGVALNINDDNRDNHRHYHRPIFS